ncbi:DUF1501 domain-containing protein [Gimesia aquarii]|uniref:Sulfatase n=1 Tax=Gimesia aquarii TaxID=2527964 RepID=A0A517VRT2_9PLAN|nr:DUF1501 domain-containing protein [Gimesia aquarii]QDT95731.1 hypothetical protein V144x_11780 [Gimesia aquarii]
MDRREFLMSTGGGLGGIALASLLKNDQLLAAPQTNTQTLHHPPHAKRVVQLYMSGAASQCDTFDYKPALIKEHGKPWTPGEEVKLFQSSPGNTMQAPWKWKQYGDSGKWLNECVAPLGECADDMAFIHNMVSKSNVHGPATFMQATGFILPGFPGMGAWISYGLGSMTDNLPTFVVLPDPRGFAPNGAANWSAGFLPASNQGTIIRPNSQTPISNLFPASNDFITRQSDRDVQAALKQLNRRHEQERAGDSRLNARIQSYELAAKMQLQAPKVLDLSNETKSTLNMYGLDSVDFEVQEGISEQAEIAYFGRNCLVARRMLEQGVRFVQIWSGADNGFPRRNWDSHEDIKRDHWPLGRGMSIGAAALIKDLKQRGMLDDTIILWTTEFGRMPCSQGSKGRDHNPFVFTNWLAGGGIKGGTTYGESDQWSFKPADPANPTMCYDVHATILHQLGIDHEKLTFRHNGIDRRLTDVHGHVIKDIIS